ncbi:helix-turn-helix domain-containing protein [Listeria ilorinensis]|uniref:helix-turn-helix domain-containing protein n=1 Tax=Listeria ilorinensis TaxID=2867439 RepID=UPI001EF52FC2|nr:helix-turn-helix transcriptional regulator [Listeria ilorinensis]
MEWLKNYRLEKKLTQQEVAKQCGIPITTYASIEQGKRRPSPERAKLIASQLGFDWTIFFND